MDEESWIQGYFAGVALHSHLRMPQLYPSVIASMSATGIAADMDWFADLSGVASLTALTADYTGNVSAAYSYDGASYTIPVPMAELLRVNPVALFHGTRPDTRRLWFRFHLSNAEANLTNFTLWGVPKEETV